MLAVDYDGSRAAGALTGSPAYANLEKALDAYNTPTGDARPAASFMDSQVRLTWLIHDVTPWRVDAVIIDGDDVWVETSMNLADGKDLFQAPAVLHRPKDTALLLATLTSLGVYGDAKPSPTSTSSPTARPVAAARVAAVIARHGARRRPRWRCPGGRRPSPRWSRSGSGSPSDGGGHEQTPAP